MQTSINLQGLYSYSYIPILVVFGIIVIFTIFVVCTRPKKKKVNTIEFVQEKKVKDKSAIKSKYLKQLYEIENKYNNKEISIRNAYQQLSESVRYFVFEMTGISTQNFSLEEIKKLNMPDLYDAIEEYYEPEFASKSEGNFEKSINKARSIVNKWN